MKEIKPVPDGPEVREGGQMNPRSETKGEGARVACWLAGLRGVQVADAMWGAGRRRCSPLSPAWASGRTAPLTELENWGNWASSQGPEVSFDVLNWSPEVGNTQLIHPAEVRAETWAASASKPPLTPGRDKDCLTRGNGVVGRIRQKPGNPSVSGPGRRQSKPGRQGGRRGPGGGDREEGWACREFREGVAGHPRRSDKPPWGWCLGT